MTKLQVYPNPTVGITYILTSKQAIGSTLYVYDDIGNIVTTRDVTNQTILIDMKSFAAGVYLVKVNYTNGQSGYTRFIKE
jgi:hypothetical protein